MNNDQQCRTSIMMPITTKEKFLEDVVETMVDIPIKKDAVKCINPSDVKLVYVWGDRYVGAADGGWTSNVANKEEIEINGEMKCVQAGTVIKGELESRSFDVVAPSFGENPPKWTEYHNLPYCVGNLIPYSADNMSVDNIIGDTSTDSLARWMKDANHITGYMITEEAKDEAANLGYVYYYLGLISQGDAQTIASMECELVNWKVNPRHSLQEYGEKVLVPYYVLEFDFEGEHYYVSSPADGSSRVATHAPTAHEKAPEEKFNEEMGGKISFVNSWRFAWFLALPIWFATNIVIALVYLAVWGGILLVQKKQISDREKEIIEEVRSGQQHLIEMLRKQLL